MIACPAGNLNRASKTSTRSGSALADYLAPFEQFVAAGKIVRRIVDEPMPHIKERRPDLDGIRNVYFAPPGEECRIDAYRRLMDTGKSGAAWTDSEERLQGSLLDAPAGTMHRKVCDTFRSKVFSTTPRAGFRG